MKVTFDKLHRLETPQLTLCNPGSVCRFDEKFGGTLTNVVGILSNTTDEELILNFNESSELNFRIHKPRRERTEEQAHVDRLYAAIQPRRLIFVADIGFFKIKDVNDGHEEGKAFKDVSAKSCEIELQDKMLLYIENGTYQFVDLLERIVATLAGWTIGHIDDVVATRYRTFENVSEEQNVLAFMMEEMQDSYDCIFIFDTISRIINVYSKNNCIINTDIYLTKEDLVNKLDISENSEELYTAISVFGSDGLTINPINPLGGNVIYDFSHYLDWMSSELSMRVISWSELVEKVKDEYYNNNLKYYELLEEQSMVLAEIDKEIIQMSLYSKCKQNIEDEDTSEFVAEYNESLKQYGGEEIPIYEEISETMQAIDDLISEITIDYNNNRDRLSEINNALTDYQNAISSIQDAVSIETYFTEQEYQELANYIFEGSYRDDNIITTTEMSYTEKFAQMKVLYDRAKARLDVVSQPTQEFSLDVQNFFFSKKFERMSEQLETGCLINVRIKEGDIASLFLSSFTINYHDRSLSMTFGNRFNKFTPKALFDSALGSVKKSANTINRVKDILYPIKNGQVDNIQEALDNVFDLIYPINTVYTSVSPKQPEPMSILGNWEKLESSSEGLYQWRRIQ